MQECRLELAPSRHTDECRFPRRLWPRRVDPRRLAASGFASLAPAPPLIMGIPILGEIPSLTDCIGVVAVSAGVFLTSGARLPITHLTDNHTI